MSDEEVVNFLVWLTQLSFTYLARKCSLLHIWDLLNMGRNFVLLPFKYLLHSSSSSQPEGHNPFDKPLTPKIFTLYFITVIESQLWSHNENNFMVGRHHKIKNYIKGSH